MVFVPGCEERMFVVHGGEILGHLTLCFFIERRVIREHIGCCVLREDFGQLVGLASDEVFDLRFLRVDLLFVGLVALDFVFGGERSFMKFGVVEDTEEGVKILRRNGIVFVIVAGGAGNGESHETAGGGVDALVLKFGAEGVEA